MGFLLLFLSITAWSSTDQIVMITDSHGVGAFGVEFRKWLKARPDTEFTFVASGGSAPLQWTNGKFKTPAGLKYSSRSQTQAESELYTEFMTPTLERLWAGMSVKEPRPKKISIIALGTNFSHLPKFKKTHIAETRALVEMALRSSDRCIWIGPPTMQKAPGFDTAGVQSKMEILSDALMGCEFIDSRPLSRYPAQGFDGVHYQWPLKGASRAQRENGKEMAIQWAQSAIKSIESILSE